MIFDVILLAVSLATLIVAAVAAVYAVLAYQLKSGIDVRGTHLLASSVASGDQYIHEITLQNLKDRAIAVFKIFLEVGHGYFIEIESFEDKPLVLGPFEAVRRQYGPIDHYTDGVREIRMGKVLSSPKARQRLVLSTAQGRYNISNLLDHWDPVVDFFRNYLTGIVRPLRSTYEGTAYGSGTKYLVKIVTSGGEQVVPIYSGDHEIEKFRGFRLTPESLKSREALELFLMERAVAGELRCSNVTVLDLEGMRDKAYRDKRGQAVVEAPRGWLTYNALGWIVTRWRKLELTRQNRAAQKRALQRRDGATRHDADKAGD